ncbi:MAG: PDZ domain-containing protein [Anaerolineae bacterium]|nr:PDZ domain-containing protein [Anaerolineae bacterium]
MFNHKRIYLWIIPLILLCLLNSQFTSAQSTAQEGDWEKHLNHNLKVTFDLPSGFHIAVESLRTYTNGTEAVTLEGFNSTQAYDYKSSLETYCQTYFGQRYRTRVQVLRQTAPAECLFASKSANADTLVILPHSPYRIGFQNNSQITAVAITAPGAYAHRIADSVTFVLKTQDIDPVLYLKETLDDIEINFVYIKQVNWPTIKQKALAMVNKNSTLTDSHRAIQFVFDQINVVGSHKGRLTLAENANLPVIDPAVFGYMTHYSPGDAYATVDLIYPGSAAEIAGLQVGDRIESFNGRAVAEFNLDELSTAVKMQSLKVKRMGQAEPIVIDFVISRSTAYLPPIGRRLSENIGYIETFTGKLDVARFYLNDAYNTFRKIDTLPVCGWILDVRRNRGGEVSSMSLALEPLRGDGVWWSFKNSAGDVKPLEYKNGVVTGTLFTGKFRLENRFYRVKRPNPPVAVLVSSETNSMGEASAFLFQTRPIGKTQVFGEPTNGLLADGIIEKVMADGSNFVVVTDLNLGPDGTPAPTRITPDEAMTPDYTVYGTDQDPMIQAASQWLQKQPECQK